MSTRGLKRSPPWRSQGLPALRLKRKRDESAKEVLELELRGGDDAKSARRRVGEDDHGTPGVLSFVRVKTVSKEELAREDAMSYVDVVPTEKFTCNGVEMIREQVEVVEPNNPDEVYDLFVMSTEYNSAAAERVRLEDSSLEHYFYDEGGDETVNDESDSQGTVDYPSTPELEEADASDDEAAISGSDVDESGDGSYFPDTQINHGVRDAHGRNVQCFVLMVSSSCADALRERLRTKLGLNDDVDASDDDDRMYTATEYMHGWHASEEVGTPPKIPGVGDVEWLTALIHSCYPPICSGVRKRSVRR